MNDPNERAEANKESTTTETKTSGDGSGIITDEEVADSKEQELDQRPPTYIEEISSAPMEKHGGPRTQRGKNHSKHNAMKHGLFSSVALLKGEPRAEFDLLISDLQSELQPEGTLEILLVDKLAVLFWRCRRLMVAEKQRSTNKPVDLIVDDLGPPPDLLLRYESSFEKAIERTLAQLERLQRIRKGQTVSPTLNLQISS